MGILYLIPSLLGESKIAYNLPADNATIINKLDYFIVEELRTARRFLKKVNREIVIDDLHFEVLNKRTSPVELDQLIQPIVNGKSAGIISEAGCPGVADPGADLVALAHKRGIKVVPLIGPSSILLSLMASGFNGQSFSFVGYLPVKPNERKKRLQQLEKRVYAEDQTQMFIEAPYRNNKLLEDMVTVLNPSTRICVACDITTNVEYVITKQAQQWKGNLPNLHKRPTIFLIYK